MNGKVLPRALVLVVAAVVAVGVEVEPELGVVGAGEVAWLVDGGVVVAGRVAVAGGAAVAEGALVVVVFLVVPPPPLDEPKGSLYC
ncbi:MAG: hypothetical protein NVS3B18_11360 [Candidatus Dormibacteria bacterium]